MVRPGESCHEQEQRQGAQAEQEHVTQPQRTLAGLGLIIEKAESGKFYQVGLGPAPQVQPKRSSDGKRAEEGEGIEQRHAHWNFFLSARNIASACQGFSSVRTRQCAISRPRNNW